MSTYRVEWPCGDVTETEAWEPSECPICALDRVTAERDAAAAKERAAVVAWLRLGCAWGVLDDYTPDQAADAIEAGDHLEASRA